METYKTGGGMKEVYVNEIDDKVISLIPNQFVPLLNVFDSDSGYHNTVQKVTMYTIFNYLNTIIII